MASTTTGQNICEEVIKLMKKFGIDSSKLVGIITSGAQLMVGKKMNLSKDFWLLL